MNGYLIIDPQKNTLFIPANAPGISEAIISSGRKNIIAHDTKTALLSDVCLYIGERYTDAETSRTEAASAVATAQKEQKSAATKKAVKK